MFYDDFSVVHVLIAVCAMQGVQFGVLQNYFTDGTPMGLLNMRDGRCVYNPASESQVRPGAFPASNQYTHIRNPPLPSHHTPNSYTHTKIKSCFHP